MEAWSEPGDPRATITWDHLLQMRSGLQWVEEYYDFDADPSFNWNDFFPAEVDALNEAVALLLHGTFAPIR